MTTFKILSATATDVVALGDSRDHVLLLELTEPARVELEGVQLLGEELDALQTSLGEKGLELVLDEVGATIPSVQVGLYAPGGTVDGVGLGSD